MSTAAVHVCAPACTWLLLLLLQEVKDEAPKPYSAREGMAGIVALLEKSVKTKETRLLMGRLMRQTAQLRGHMNAADLQAFITTYLPADSKSGAYLAGYIKQVRAWGGGACSEGSQPQGGGGAAGDVSGMALVAAGALEACWSGLWLCEVAWLRTRAGACAAVVGAAWRCVASGCA